MKATVFIGALLAINAVSAFSQNEGQSSSVPAQMIVTVESRHGRDVPALNREDFMVYQGKERVQLVDALPLQGDNADLELFLLIDDASDWRLGTQLGDLRRFLDAQAAGTAVEIGYMRNGTIDTIAELTKDHTRAAGALRLPMGASTSPYLSLSDLIRRWPKSSARREVLMVTSGADPLGGSGITNPYLDAAIEDAQRAGIIVYAIYAPGTGHAGHSYWRMSWGQNYLAELADETSERRP